MGVIWSLIGFILVMGLIVTIHEWGHYQVARWFDIKVLKFSIGFGKPIYSRTGKETEFVIAQIPLGGYVKFADEREAPVAPEDMHRAFNRQSVYKRFAVVAAGPLINLLFAWVVFALMYMVGTTGIKPIISGFTAGSPLAEVAKPYHRDFATDQAWSISQVNGQDVSSWQMVHQQILQVLAKGDKRIDFRLSAVNSGHVIDLKEVALNDIDLNQPNQDWLKLLGFMPSKPIIPAVLGEVLQGGSAQKAGLLTGDKILSIDQKSIYSWQDFVKVVQAHPDQLVKIEFERDKAVFNQAIELSSSVLENGEKVGRMGVGVQVDEQVLAPYEITIQYGFIEALSQAYQRSVDLVSMSLVMLKRMVIGEVSTSNLSGPLSIAQFSGQAVQTGLVAFLSLLGLLSLSIGILNLLPIPVLDGGHLVFYLIEMIKGSPVSEQIMAVGQTLGLILLVGLTFLALFNDVIRISHG
ncbi:MAG: RIP metalloprotease RseP [Thiomicrorhabdus sp.]|nr:RIP metalloprotease RseP [Thiomicrorhabdus sp.]